MEINKSDNFNIIRELYETDPKFAIFFPDECKTLEDCVKLSLSQFIEMKEYLDFYLVKENDVLLGYFALGKKNNICGFFLKPEYRKRKKEFWNLIMNTAQKPLYALMPEKNVRASRFYNEMGGELLIKYPESNEVMQMFKFKEIE